MGEVCQGGGQRQYRGPLVEGVVEESSEEEAEAGDPADMKKGRTLRRANSGEPVQPGRAEARQGVSGEIVCMTRAAAAKKEAGVVKNRELLARFFHR